MWLPTGQQYYDLGVSSDGIDGSDRGVHCQVGWGPGQPGLALDMEVGSPACGREIGAWWSLRSLPTQDILQFYDHLITGFCTAVPCLNELPTLASSFICKEKQKINK